MSRPWQFLTIAFRFFALVVFCLFIYFLFIFLRIGLGVNVFQFFFPRTLRRLKAERPNFSMWNLFKRAASTLVPCNPCMAQCWKFPCFCFLLLHQSFHQVMDHFHAVVCCCCDLVEKLRISPCFCETDCPWEIIHCCFSYSSLLSSFPCLFWPLESEADHADSFFCSHVERNPLISGVLFSQLPKLTLNPAGAAESNL